MSDNNYAGRAGLSAVFAAIKSAINEKVSKEVGKELSTNDYTDHDKNLVNTMEPYLDAVHIGASGNPIVVQAQDAPVLGLDVSLNPIQDLHGYDKPWVGGSGKNKLPMTVSAIKAANTSGTWNGNVYSIANGTIEMLVDSADNVLGFKAKGTFNTTVIFAIMPSANLGITGILNGAPATGSLSTYEIQVALTGETYRDYGSGTSAFNWNEAQKAYIVLRSGYATPTDGIIFRPMFRLSTESDASFAPYSNICPISGRTEVAVDDVGKNLYNNEVGSSSHSNITYTKNADGTIKATGAASANSYYNMSNVVFPAGTYAFNGCPSDGADSKYKISLFNVTTQQTIGNGDTGSGNTFTANGTDEYRLFIRVNSGYAFPTGGLIFKPMVRLASITDDTYVPYAHSSATIQLGTTVYGGTVDFDTGVATVTKALATFTGAASENWLVSGTTNPRFILNADIGIKNVGADSVINAISSSYSIVSANSTCLGTTGISTESANSACLAVFDEQRKNMTAEQWKTWLASNNLQVCYELATPIELTLTPAVLNLLKGYNYITGDGDMSIMYVPESILPTPPTADGTYKLICTVSGGALAFSWESDT